MLFLKSNRRSVIERELREIARREMKLATAAYHTKESPWKGKIEQLIPDNVHTGLEKAFAAGFALLIEQGSSLLEKSFDRESIRREFERRDAAVQTRGTRRELRELYRAGRQTGNAGTAFAAVEGTALGAVGIGMPDIVFFLSVLLRGVMQVAAQYGFDSSDPHERLLILSLMETPLRQGTEWTDADRGVDALLRTSGGPVEQALFQAQLRKTASAFALDMLIMKFIQGMPIVGIIGGLSDPICYRKIITYAELKYRKRYLTRMLSSHL